MNFHKNIKSGYYLATLAGIITILLWASNIAFSRSVMDREGSMNTAFYIYFYSAIVIFLMILIFQPGAISFRRSGLLSIHLKSGIFFIVNNVLLFVAVGMAAKNEELVIVALLNYTWPILVYITAIPLLGLKIPAKTLLPGVLLALAGVFLALLQGSDIGSIHRILQAGNDNLLAYFLAFLTALSWALYTNLTVRHESGSDLKVIPIVFMISSFIFLMILAVTGKLSTISLTAPLRDPELVYLILGPTSMGYLGWYIAIKKGNRNLVTSLSFFIPLLSLLIIHFRFKVPVSLLFWAAAMLLIAGSYLFYRSAK